ncbi:MAG: type VII secretion protein EccE, partial [Mycobacterium sp.]
MTARITLALLFIVPAAMTYPWHSTQHRWVLGVAVAVVLIVFAWWRGQFLTTMIGSRFAMWRRRNVEPAVVPADRVSVAVQVDPTDDAVELPLPTVAGYLDRYGIRCDSVRVVTRAQGQSRTTWVGLTIDATANLAALQARSSALPLRETAQIVARRLGDQLRESGFRAAVVDQPDAPLQAGARETWRAIQDGDGYLTAYGLPTASGLSDGLAAQPSASEIWTVLEFSSGTRHSVVAAACAVRTETAPAAATAAGLVSVRG